MIEQQCDVNGISIKYKTKSRKYDTTHLVVVFSGFGGGNEFTYDFVNALQECPANILWIKDDFHDHCAYYMCRNMNFEIETAVHKFINEKLSELNLTKEQCTLAGFSKGGTAALYFGIKYQFKNIVSTVPQFNIGTYASENWPIVAEHMLGDVSVSNLEEINGILPKAIKNDNNYDKNIYLLTSESDIQYLSEIQPNLHTLIKYKNFNLLLSKSILVREHNQVTAHHAPLILGILYSLSQGATPIYGYTELSGDKESLPSKPSKEPLAILKKIKVDRGNLFVEGISILRGLSCKDYKDIDVKLCLSSDSGETIIDLAKTHRPSLTRQLYDGTYVNYDKGWFCTLAFKGISINLIPDGKHSLSIIISCQGVTKKSDMTVDTQNDNKPLTNTSGIKSFSENGKVYLYKNQ